MAAPPTPNPSHAPDPLVFDGLAIRIRLWSSGTESIISAIALAPPRPPRRYIWTSRAGGDEGKKYPVAAYVKFATGAFEGGWIIITRTGGWELRAAIFDGFELDVRRLISPDARRRVGEIVWHESQPALETWRSQQNGHAVS